MTSDRTSGRRRRRLALVAAAVTTLGAAAGAVWWIQTRDAERPLEPGWSALVGVLAGEGVSGWRDGPLSHARFSEPFGTAAGADGSIYVSDAGNVHRIRAITPAGSVLTIAGSERGFADGPGRNARFDTPSGLALDPAGTLYVADTGNNAIRRITRDGFVSTVAGDGVAGDRDGAARTARFNGPVGVAVDAAGRILVADTYNDRIRAIAPDGTVSTLAGSGTRGADDGRAMAARFDTPCDIVVDRAGAVLVADTANGTVRRIDANGTVTTLAALDSSARPIALSAGQDGEVYVSDERGRIVEIGASGGTRVLAGSSTGFQDGPGERARFRRPAGVALLGPGRLVVADAGNSLVRLLSASSRVDLRLPPRPFIRPRFDADAFGRVPLLWPAAPMEGPHEVAGTIGEARGSEGSERFHAGIDVRLEQGTHVLAVRDGTVSSPISNGEFDSLNEWLRIGPIGYVHVRAGRARHGRNHVLLDPVRFVPSYDETGALSGIRVKRGARFVAGEPVATVNAFNHVHLNVGWPGEEHNPLRFRLAQFADTVPPTIPRAGVRLFDASGEPLTDRVRGRLAVTGRVRIVVDAWDQADGNRPGRRLGIYALGYDVLRPDGARVDRAAGAAERIRFDQLGSDSEAPRIVYAPGSGIPHYGTRRTRFLYTVTNSFLDGAAREDLWDTSSLDPGHYTLRVWATDFSGNTTERDLPVTVVNLLDDGPRTRDSK